MIKILTSLLKKVQYLVLVNNTIGKLKAKVNLNRLTFVVDDKLTFLYSINCLFLIKVITMDFKNLKNMASQAKKQQEEKLKAQEKSLIGNMELPFIHPEDHLGLLEELSPQEFLHEIGG